MANKHKKVEDLLADDSFIRWIDGKAPPREVSYWKNWLNEKPGREKTVREAKKIHSDFQFKPKMKLNVDSELARLNRAVAKSKPFKLQIITRLNYKKRDSRHWPQFAAVIIFLLTVLAAAHFLFPEAGVHKADTDPVYAFVQTDYGEKKRITFTDGSSIILNGNTRLAYPSKITSDIFAVHLEGEAWFEITSETGQYPQRIFTVHTRDGEIEVLGTEFNVNTWQDRTEVVLQEGETRVKMKGNRSGSITSYEMKPGELARFAYSGESIEVDRINTELYTSWIQNRLVFDRSSLTDVAERIGQIYGVRFVVDNEGPNMEEIRISGSLPNDDLQVFLNALESLLEHPVSFEDKTIHIGEKPGR